MKKKANLRRFLLNRYIAYVTWIMMFLPIVILFFDTAVETDKPFYQIAIVVFVFAFDFVITTTPEKLFRVVGKRKIPLQM